MKAFGCSLAGACLVSSLWLTPAHAQDYYQPGTQLSPHGPTTPAGPVDYPNTAMEIPALQGSPTYTYLRCHYRNDSSPTATSTGYEWATTAGGDWYRVNGYWWKDGLLQWSNMFYSATTQQALNDICTQTLLRKGIRTGVAMHAAADNALSLNYTVWTNGGTASGTQAERIIAFGDSLSDTGNVYNATQWLLPNRDTWYLGRFSNGPLWTEHLSASTNLPLYNWAVGAAGADGPFPLLDLIDQVKSWATYMREAKDYDPDNTLFLMLIGGNDLVNYGKKPTAIISKQRAALELMIDNGAYHIIVSNLPDVSHAPVFKLRNDRAEVAAAVRTYNAELALLVEELNRNRAVRIRLFDAFTFFRKITDNPVQAGFENATDSCLDISTDAFSNYLKSHARRPGCRPEAFVFWDTLHPTSKMHRLMAEDVLRIIPSDWLSR